LTSLNLPLISKLDYSSCGFASFKIVTKFFGIKIYKKDSIFSNNLQNKNTLPEIALALSNIGLKTKLILFNKDIFPTTFNINYPLTALLNLNNMITTLTPKKRAYIKTLIEYIKLTSKSESKVIFDSFSKEEIKTNIAENKAIITIVNSQIFSQNKITNKNSQHIIPIREITNEKIIFSLSNKITRKIDEGLLAIYKAKIPSLLMVWK